MTYIVKPKFHHPALPKNALGYTHRDYEGSVSTLCAGCGHNSISAAIIEACFELAIEPHRVAKLSGIGCSSKTPTYFLGQSHGFNSVHGRMPSVLTGANLANRDLIYLGVSGDGDSRLDRARPVRARDPARRQHGLHRREQRRVRPDQGPVLGHRRPRLEGEARRDQQRFLDRPRRDGDAARRDLRGALVLRRQGAARADHQGGDRAQGRGVHRRALALRRVQQSSRLDQELRLRAHAQRGGEPARLHHRPRADQGRLRARHGRDRRAARRLEASRCASSMPNTTSTTSSPR